MNARPSALGRRLLDVDAVEQIIQGALVERDARRPCLMNARQSKRAAVEPFVAQDRMPVFPLRRRVLCA
jgi:hypothetical protein